MQICERAGAIWGVRWKCIHVLMHVHFLVKVKDQMRAHAWGHIGAEMYPTNKIGKETGNKQAEVNCKLDTEAHVNAMPLTKYQLVYLSEFND